MLFSSSLSVTWASLIKADKADGDSIINKVYELDPELKELDYVQKRELFKDSLLYYLVVFHREDVLSIKDSVIINFIVNGSGHVDSVWLVTPKTFPFKNTYKFIKGYDFKGSLVEFYTTNSKLYSCTVELILFLNREDRKLYMFFDCTHIKEE